MFAGRGAPVTNDGEESMDDINARFTPASTAMRAVSAGRSRGKAMKTADDDRNTFLTNAFVLKAMRGDADAVRLDVARGRRPNSVHSVRLQLVWGD